jgi:Cu2+-exporting ATPase
MDHGMHHPATDKDTESDHNKTIQPMHHGGEPGSHQTGAGAHVHDLEDFKKRFIISTIITIPILFLSPVIQSFFRFHFDFSGSMYVTLILASIV